MTLYSLTLSAPAAVLEATDTENRTLSGVAVPYGEVGHTSAGALSIDAGAIVVPSNLRAVKLFREHGRSTPIGYALSATSAADGLHMTFHVARTPDGDLAILEASEGLRDSLSVELSDVQVKAGRVTAARLVGVAQVAVPAYESAVLVASLTDAEQVDAHAAAVALADALEPDDPTDDPTDDGTDDGAVNQTDAEETMPESTVDGGRPTGMVPVQSRSSRTPANDRELFAAAAAVAFTGASDAAQVNAALADIVPPVGADPLMPPAYLGELWTPRAVARPFITAIGSTALTSMTWSGWRWSVYPQVADYAGRKAAIPTNPAAIEPAVGEASRIAGGWDIDRIYDDFNTGFISAFLDAATVSYAIKSEASAVSVITAEATDAGGSESVPGGLVLLAQALAAVGASMNYVGMAPDVFAAFLGMTRDSVPWFIPSQGSVNIAGLSTEVGGVSIFSATSLANGTMVAGDRNAVDFRETGPIRVQAINLPNGGIDVALFGYQGAIVQSAAAIVKTTVTLPVTPLVIPSP